MAKFLDVTSPRVFSAALWEFLRRTRPADQPAAASLRRAEKTLTDAQIKALPGTPIIIVPAPAAGYMINPLSGLLVCDFSGGLYEDEVEGESVDGKLGFSTDMTVSGFGSGYALLSPFTLVDDATTVLGVAASGIVRGHVTGSGGEPQNTLTKPFELDKFDGLALSFGLINRDSVEPLVGGHADNYIKVILYYDIVPTV